MSLTRRSLIATAAGGAILYSTPTSAAAALPGWLTWWEDDDYTFHGGIYDPPRQLFELINAVDQNGKPFTFADHLGEVIFVYFGYTYCPDACPATLSEWREVQAELGDDAAKVNFVMVTVDPERDSPARMKEYIEFWDPSFYGVSMSLEDTTSLTSEWGITAIKETPEANGTYTVTHDVSTYVVDPKGQLRLTYPLGFDPADMAEDIRHLLNGD